MRFSESHIPTLREDPAEAELVSYKLMLRSGMIRKVASGIYSYLPLGVKVLRKVEDIIREEMERAGAQEVILPCILPAELWQETGRWSQYGKELLRMKDRHDREFCFGPTHEEAITALVRDELRSYKQLPVTLFQIQTKFRDEIRPRFGVMRAREFVMKDAYSFDKNVDGALETYEKIRSAYVRIFERCGLDFRVVEADTGMIGGHSSHEFMVLADSGEEEIVSCSSCSYSANMEKAACALPKPDEPAAAQEMLIEKIATDDKKSGREVSEFLNIHITKLVKTIVYDTSAGVVAVLIRGDLQVNESKLKSALQAEEVRLADADTIFKIFNVEQGYIGPVGLDETKFLADNSVKDMSNFVVGANEKGFHYINCNHPRDFNPDFASIMTINEGDPCPQCGSGLNITRGIEVGHIFMLGEKYSKKMKAVFLDENGKEKPFYMGCYGIGVGRVVAAAIEQNYSEKGILWPFAIAPYQLIIIPLNVKNERIATTAELIYNSIMRFGVVMLDDRNERAGVKFKDAALIGAPFQLIIGEKTLNEGYVEFVDMKQDDKKLVPVEDILDLLRQKLDRRKKL